jgi:hypothetical protein
MDANLHIGVEQEGTMVVQSQRKVRRARCAKTNA